MKKILDSLLIIEKIEYRKKQDKNKLWLPFYNYYIYLLQKTVFACVLGISLILLFDLIKKRYLPIGYVILALAVYMLLQCYLVDTQISLFDDKYNIVSYLNGGMFTRKQKNKNKKIIEALLIFYNGGLGILLILVFELLNVCVIKDNIISLACLGLMPVIIYLFNIKYEYIKWIKKNINNIKNKDCYFGIIISFIAAMIIKLLDYKLENISKSGIRKTIDSSLKSDLSIYLVAFVVIYIITLLLANVIKKNKKYYLNGIYREFFYKEVESKIIFFNCLLVFFLLFDFKCLKENLLMTVLVSFLFTVYNNRFLLNDSFSNYYYMINSKRKMFSVITKETMVFGMALLIISTFIINQISLNLLKVIIFNVGLYFLNIIINLFIYRELMKKKADQRKKMNYIEIISGGLYLSEILVAIMI